MKWVDWWKMLRLSTNDLIPSLFVNTEVYQGLAVIFKQALWDSQTNFLLFGFLRVQPFSCDTTIKEATYFTPFWTLPKVTTQIILIKASWARKHAVATGICFTLSMPAYLLLSWLEWSFSRISCSVQAQLLVYSSIVGSMIKSSNLTPGLEHIVRQGPFV